MLVVLAVLAAAAVAGVLVTREPAVAPPTEIEAGERLVPWLEARLNEVAGVRVRRPGGDLVARVVRRDGQWRVANRADYPSDTETLRGTLIKLSRARRLEPKSDRPEGWARLGVAAIERGVGDGVELALEGLGRDLAVLIGRPAAGDVGGTYVRIAGERRAWLVSGDLERHDRVGDWLDDRLVSIPAGRVRSVRIEAVDGEPVVVRQAEAGSGDFALNVPEGRRALSTSIAQSLARIVADLRLDDVRPAADAPELPQLATARFRTFDGLVIEIEAFARGRAPEGDRFVRLRARATAEASAAVRERAAALAERFEGWAYEIPRYKFVNATQTLEGVLE